LIGCFTLRFDDCNAGMSNSKKIICTRFAEALLNISPIPPYFFESTK
jgi:hypothetical protein